MTLRLVIGIDPGLSGAIAALADGVPSSLVDMPTIEVYGWREVDGAKLISLVRGICSAHRGAWIHGCVERVKAMPKDGGTSAFRFGESYCAARMAFEALNIPYERVTPQKWKRHFGLIGAEDKDASRQLALARFELAHLLARKKDHGRAEALLIAQWLEDVDQAGARAA